MWEQLVRTFFDMKQREIYASREVDDMLKAIVHMAEKHRQQASDRKWVLHNSLIVPIQVTGPTIPRM